MICLIAGEEKTGKTTFALTFPKPLEYFEFDLGGFDRAKSRFKPEELAQIKVRKFPSFLKSEFKDKSLIETLRIYGEKERWQKFMAEFNEACTNDSKTIVLDTWYQVYELVRQAYLQTLQEAQLDEHGQLKREEKKLRENLTQTEYAQPYAKLRGILFYARASEKNLVLVTYDTDEYKSQIDADGKIKDVRTGRKIPSGWKETEKHVDISFWTSRNKNNIDTVITLPGAAPLELVGANIPNNSYDSLMQVLSLA